MVVELWNGHGAPGNEEIREHLVSPLKRCREHSDPRETPHFPPRSGLVLRISDCSSMQLVTVFYFPCPSNLERDSNSSARTVAASSCGGRRIAIKHNNDDTKKENKNKRIKSRGNSLRWLEEGCHGLRPTRFKTTEFHSSEANVPK